MNKKIVIPVIALIIVLTGGILAWQFWPQKVEIPPPANEIPKVNLVTINVAPKVILTGNLAAMSVGVREGHVATFDIYHENELVGTRLWKRVEENKTKEESIRTIDRERKKMITTIKHNVDLKVQQANVEVEIDDIKIDPRMSIIFNHQKSETIVKASRVDNELEKIEMIRFRQNPDAFEKINIQTLEVGWKREFPIIEITSIDPIIEANPGSITIEVIDQKTITVPAGTFDVLRVEVNLEMMEISMIYYITPEGKLIKFVSLQENLVYKLRDYSPIAETQSK